MPVAVKAELVHRLVAAGYLSSRPRASCTRGGFPSSRTRTSCWPGCRPTGSPLALPSRCSCPTSRGSTARSKPGCSTWRSSAARPRASRGATSTVASTSSTRCSNPSCVAPSLPGSPCGLTCPCASATRGRATYPSSRSSTPASRLLDLGATQLSLGDTIGVGTAGHVTALVEAFGANGVGVGSLALHFHDTYGQALANVLAGLRRRRHDVRRLGRWPGRMPVRGECDRQPRDRGPGVDAGRSRCPHRCRPDQSGDDERLAGASPRSTQPVARRPSTGGALA